MELRPLLTAGPVISEELMAVQGLGFRVEGIRFGDKGLGLDVVTNPIGHRITPVIPIL